MNVLSIDLESWVHKYHIEEDMASKKRKDSGYIREATNEILDILEGYGINTTFFIISEVFEWYPDLIYTIRDKGHELGFHTHTHRILVKKDYLVEELKAGKDFIEEFDVKGFRAPQAYMRSDYLPILRDWGFTYDSSIYSKFQLFEPMDGLLEAPISTYPISRKEVDITFPRNLTFGLMAREIPFGSGYYIGLLGFGVSWFINRVNKRNIPASLFMHPWQIRALPDMRGGYKGSPPNRVKMLPYSINRKASFDRLLQSHTFKPMARIINTYGNEAGYRHPVHGGETR